MTMVLQSYGEVFRKSFQKSMVYKLSYWTSLLGDFVLAVLAITLWSTLVRTGMPTVDLDQVVTYVTIARAARTSLTLNLEIELRVRTGDIISELLRPIHFQVYQFFYALGAWCHTLLMRALPIYIAFWLLGDVRPPSSPAALAAFVIALLLAFATMFAITFAVAMISFWTVQMWSVLVIRDSVIAVFSGLIVPVWFMPDQLQRIVAWLPFRGMIDTPIRFYLGSPGTNAPLAILGTQFTWVVALLLVGHLVWRQAVQKINVQGG